MILKNYKHIKHLEFNLNQTQFIFTKDYFLKNDFLELSRLIFANKKIPSETLVKWTEYDHFYNLKNLRIISVPSFLDFQKDFINGNKSLIKIMVYEILTILEPRNNTLITVQNLLTTFKLEDEFAPLKNLFEMIKENYGIGLESIVNDSLTNILIDQIKLVLIDKFGNNINEDLIEYDIFKNLYLEFLIFLEKIIDEETLVIFDDPFYGLKNKEKCKLYEIMQEIKNKIVCCYTFPNLDVNDLKFVFLIMKTKSLDFSNIFNNLEEYKFYLDEPVSPIMDNVINNLIGAYNQIDEGSLDGLFNTNKNEETLFKAILNK